MDIIIYEFNDHKIEFELNGDKNVKVNATQMAKVFGKRVDHFLKADHVKRFINVLEFPPNGVNSAPLKRDKIIKTKGHSGTYMHRILALKFAAWLNPVFEVWVYMTIEKLIFGHFAKQKKRLESKAKNLNRIEILEKELLQNPTFKEYAELQANIKKDVYLGRKENAQQLNFLKELFREKQ